MRAPVRQQALTVVLPVRSGQAIALGRWLEAHADEVKQRLAQVASLHCGRFVVLPGSDAANGVSARLAFESNFDGALDAHVVELWARVGRELAFLFEHCEGWRSPGDASTFARYLRAHRREASAFFVAHPGLSVPRVQADARLRLALGRYLDEQRATLEPLAAPQIVAQAREALRAAAEREGFDLEPVDRGMQDAPRSTLAVLLGHALALATTFVLAFFHDFSDFVSALWHDTALVDGEPATLARIGLEEAGRVENGLTHVVRVKPGRFRRATLRLALRVTDELAVVAAPTGRLGGIDSIHFARWVLLEDGSLVFFSNYDGSLEAYLGDFIERASRALTMIWSNTLGFPATVGWIFAGARDEARFKRWTRARQLPTPLWYSAYAELSVGEILANAEIREILARDLDLVGARRVLELVRD